MIISPDILEVHQMCVFLLMNNTSKQQSAFREWICKMLDWHPLWVEMHVGSVWGSFLTRNDSVCGSPGDPQGGTWARQDRGDGCGRHNPEERLLHRRAQSQKTLTEQRKAERKQEGNSSLRELTLLWPPLNPSGLSLTPPPHPHPSHTPAVTPFSHSVNDIQQVVCLQNSEFLPFFDCPWIKQHYMSTFSSKKTHLTP